MEVTQGTALQCPNFPSPLKEPKVVIAWSTADLSALQSAVSALHGRNLRVEQLDVSLESNQKFATMVGTELPGIFVYEDNDCNFVCTPQNLDGALSTNFGEFEKCVGRAETDDTTADRSKLMGEAGEETNEEIAVSGVDTKCCWCCLWNEEDYKSIKPQTFEGKNLLLFFVIAFVYSWIVWGILAVINAQSQMGLVPNTLGALVGAFGPFISSSYLTFKSHGWRGLKLFWKSGFLFKRVPLWMYAMMIGWPLIVQVVCYVMMSAVFTPENPDDVTSSDDEYEDAFVVPLNFVLLPLYVMFMYIGGPLQEEHGWRGYALDRLMLHPSVLRYPIVSTFVIGVIWGVWHLPLWFVPGSPQTQIHFGAFTLYCLVTSVPYTLFHMKTGWNVTTAIFFHATTNGFSFPFIYLGEDTIGTFYWVSGVTSTVLALICFGVFHKLFLTPAVPPKA